MLINIYLRRIRNLREGQGCSFLILCLCQVCSWALRRVARSNSIRGIRGAQEALSQLLQPAHHNQVCKSAWFLIYLIQPFWSKTFEYYHGDQLRSTGTLKICLLHSKHTLVTKKVTMCIILATNSKIPSLCLLSVILLFSYQRLLSLSCGNMAQFREI